MNDFISLKDLEEKKLAATIKYNQEIDAIYIEQMEIIMRWFVWSFPKRNLKWVSGMGTCFWVLDGEILHWETLVERSFDNGWTYRWVEPELTRQQKVLLPLYRFLQSINDATNVDCNVIDIGDFNSNNYK